MLSPFILVKKVVIKKGAIAMAAAPFFNCF